jgi:hypothetical protein
LLASSSFAGFVVVCSLRRRLLASSSFARFVVGLVSRFRRYRCSGCSSLLAFSFSASSICLLVRSTIFRLRRDLGKRWPASRGPLGPFWGADTGKATRAPQRIGLVTPSLLAAAAAGRSPVRGVHSLVV